MSYEPISRDKARRDAANIRRPVSIHPQILIRDRRTWYDQTLQHEAVASADETKSMRAFFIERANETWRRGVELAKFMGHAPPDLRENVAARLALSRFIGRLPIEQTVYFLYADESGHYAPGPDETFLIDYDDKTRRDSFAVIASRKLLATMGINLGSEADAQTSEEWFVASENDLYLRVSRPAIASAALKENLAQASGGPMMAEVLINTDTVMIQPYLSIQAVDEDLLA